MEPVSILALNSGSNSLKFEAFRLTGETGDPLGGESLLAGSFDNIGKQGGTFKLLDGPQVVFEEEAESKDYGVAAERLIDWLEKGEAAKHSQLKSLAECSAIGHRVVHGGLLFPDTAQLTDESISGIESLSDLAPLHNDSALQVIRTCRKRLGDRLPMYAAFDTVFHRAIPDRASTYGLPVALARKHHIRRYGFHGLSHCYLATRYAQLSRQSLSDVEIVTCHLEGGSSACAISGGRSVDTSMGFTPLEGLLMGTRTGDLDPAIVTYLMRKENFTVDQVDSFLNKECGLKGLSGVSGDTRVLVKRTEDKEVALALEVYAYRVRKYIGAYLAALRLPQAVVLGGGIAENTPSVRRAILENLDWLGIELDHNLNEEVVDREGVITRPDARIPVWVIPTRENLMVAHETARSVRQTIK